MKTFLIGLAVYVACIAVLWWLAEHAEQDESHD